MAEQTIKYIRFRLPSGGGGMAPAMVGAKITGMIKRWADAAGVEHKCLRQGYRLDVCFGSQADYGMFLLSWNPPYPSDWYKPEIGYDESSGLYTQ